MLPGDLRGLADTKAVITYLLRAFALPSRDRYPFFVNLKPSELVQIITFDFMYLLPTSGYPLFPAYASRYSQAGFAGVFSFLSEMIEFVAEFACDVAYYLIPYFLVPLRSYSSSYTDCVIMEFCSERMSYLSLGNDNFTYLDRILAWLVLYRLDDPFSPAVAACKEALRELDRRETKASFAAAKTVPPASPSLSSRSSPSSSKKSKNSPPSPKKSTKPLADLGPCKGYCFSVFFGKSCPRVAAGNHCVSGGVNLKHAGTFQKLAASVQSSLQSHFDAVIKPSMNQSQIDFYN